MALAVGREARDTALSVSTSRVIWALDQQLSLEYSGNREGQSESTRIKSSRTSF